MSLAVDVATKALVVIAAAVGARASAQVPRLFEELPPIDHAVSPRAVVAVDLDQDQAPDLARIDGSGDVVHLLMNDGTGRMAPPCAVAIGADPRDIATADWDGDGDQDLFVAARSASVVSILLNQFPQTAGGCPLFARQDVPVAPAPAFVRVADLNGDGVLDIVVAWDQGVHAYWSGAGAGVQLNAAAAGFKNPRGIAIGDIDGDQRLDVITSSGGMAAPQRLDVLWNDMTLGTTAWATTVSNWINAVGTSAVAGSIAVADLDGNGRQDFAVAYAAHPLAVVLNGGNRFLSFVPAAVGAPGALVQAVDVDHDGASDLVSVAGSNVAVLYNRYAGDVSLATAQDEELRPLEVGMVVADLAPADLDRDGDVDLALAARVHAGGWTGRDPLLFNQTYANVRQPQQGLLLRGASALGSLQDLQVWDGSYLRLEAADPTLPRTAYRATFLTGGGSGSWLRVSMRSLVHGSQPGLTAQVRVHAWNWVTQKLNWLGFDQVGGALHTTQIQVPIGPYRNVNGDVVLAVQHIGQAQGSTLEADVDSLNVEIVP